MLLLGASRGLIAGAGLVNARKGGGTIDQRPAKDVRRKDVRVLMDSRARVQIASATKEVVRDAGVARPVGAVMAAAAGAVRVTKLRVGATSAR